MLHRLVSFSCVLAVSNLGTSLAAAFLVKDTKTDPSGKFVDSRTGQTLGTDSSSTTFLVDKELTDRNRRTRRLVCETIGEDEDILDCDATAFNAVTLEDGAACCESTEENWDSVGQRQSGS